MPRVAARAWRLYAHANESKGLYRLRDTTGDDQYDEVTLLYESPGTTGHGRNDLALGPDSLVYAIHGDAVSLPRGFFDHTSPLRESRRGFVTREGHVIRTDPDGQQWELLTAGLRNPYGLAFNRDGEMFTYDADAEYDMGSSWYRPTRVHHLLPGGDYGWRGVTKSWPPYFPDRPDAAPPDLDIGKGSPTGVKFGYRSNFPPAYGEALFALDWAYGRILAVHLAPRGASYWAKAETFLQGRPLNVTDLDFGPDGAMYFVTGGRKTQSGLYRVRYTGPKVKPASPTAQQMARAQHAKSARELRRRLEALHGRQDSQAVDVCWPHLDSQDPWIRHAARIALEHQPPAQWRSRALSEARPMAKLTSLMSLAAGGASSDSPAILERLNAMDLRRRSTAEKLLALRCYDLCLAALDAGAEDHQSLIDVARRRLVAGYPDPEAEVNRALSQLLARLQAPELVPRTLAWLARANTPTQRFHCLFVLRNARHGWTNELREQYFNELRKLPRFQGGEGMPAFVQRIRAEALASLDGDLRPRMEALLSDGDAREDLDKIVTPGSRPFVRKWRLEELLQPSQGDAAADSKRGAALFASGLCAACHRLGDTGRAVGPDLTSVARRFSRRDLLESILTPSKVVAENYRDDVLVTADGRLLVGRIVPSSDYRSSTLQIATHPLAPEQIVEIDKRQVESHVKSHVSVMPQGLLDVFTRQEILDLLAFIESGGR